MALLDIRPERLQHGTSEAADLLPHWVPSGAKPVGGRLKHPVHFLCPADLIWPELLDGTFRTTVPNGDRSLGTLNNWILRTCAYLRAAGEDVTISDCLRPEAINIADVRRFGRRQRRPDCFVVIPRADAHAPMLADFTVHQNGLTPATGTSGWVAHWRQPGIIPRDAARGTRIRKVTFKGEIQNLDESFRSTSFRQALRDLGVEFEADLVHEGAPVAWNDYSGCDLVLAFRNLTLKDARHKPASKLVNAWAAGVPALLGPEPAFRELRKTPLDFIEIRSPEEALSAVKRLLSGPELYSAMAANGLRRAGDVTDEMTTSRWIELLNGPIGRAYETWKGRSAAGKLLATAIGFALEPLSKRLHDWRAIHGPRLVPGTGPQG